MAPHSDSFAKNTDIVALSETEWRIGDTPEGGLNLTLLRGFVVKLGDVFEVSEIGSPRLRRYYATFDDAVTSLEIGPGRIGTEAIDTDLRRPANDDDQNLAAAVQS